MSRRRHTRKTGMTSTTMRRDDLKPKPERTDNQLIADARRTRNPNALSQEQEWLLAARLERRNRNIRLTDITET